MESNRDEACRCIELAKLYIKKKDLDIALKFSTKANKLFPTAETKLLMKKLKSTMKTSKPLHKKTNQPAAGDSNLANDSSSSSTSVSDDTEQIKKKLKQKNKSKTTYSYTMFKEINKGESYKCLEHAEQCIQKKQFELAEKYITKSKKLYFLLEADELLKKLQEVKESNKPTYTKEQEDFVNKMKTSENYYKMLDVNTTATVLEIKKAYKKLALLLHPDKNSAPGSGEMFIVVSNAVDTLCDQTKRINYDQTLKKPTISTFNHYYPQSSFQQRSTSFHNTSNYTSRNTYEYYDWYGSSENEDDFIDNDYYASYEYYDYDSYEY